MFTIFYTFSYFIPVFGGSPQSSYLRALLGNAATSALRLHQRMPEFRLSREYLGQLFLEDSAHYLYFSLLFVTTSTPMNFALIPVFLYAVLHAQSYTKQLINLVGPTALPLVRRLLAKIEAQQVQILRFIASSEIFLMPAIILSLLVGQMFILMPFLYYRFLSLRYSSRRNPYCRQVFSELRVGTEMLCNKPQCPQLVRSLCFKSIAFICRLAPVQAA